jgi:AbrB family looped-hinge helix DNA binding protein
MKAAIDEAGRVVIPKRLREELGLTPGPVEIVRDGAAVRIEPVTDRSLKKVGHRLVIPASGGKIDDDDVRDLRLLDQR